MILKTLRYFAAFAFAMTLQGCSAPDPYAEQWQRVQIGDSRADAVKALGMPSAVNALEVPLVKFEQLAWRSPLDGRLYLMVTVLDRVAAKSIIN